MKPKRTAVLLALAVLVVATVPVGTAFADQTQAADVTPAWAETYAADIYEGGAGDDISLNARDLTPLMGVSGVDYTEDHTFDKAHTAGLPPQADFDWFKFTITTQEVASGNLVLLFEAIPTGDPNVNPVIEIYGPGVFFTANPLTLPQFTTDPNAVASAVVSNYFEHYGASLDFRPTLAGTYYIRVRPYGDNVPIGGSYYGTAGKYKFRAKWGTFVRIAGADRYETAAAISREKYADTMLDPVGMWPNLSTAIIASGQNFPDALAGSFLAGVTNGPILLTRTSSLPPATSQELVRLDPGAVIVLGGAGAVSDSVMAEIQAALPTAAVTRVFGDDRIDTAVKIAADGAAQWAGAGNTLQGFCIVANARNFPDALSASSFAAAWQVPVFLTDAASLDPRVATQMTALSITDVIMVGGTGVLSPNVESQLVAQVPGDATHVLRLAGATRYETSMKFAAWSAEVPGNTGWVGTPGNPIAFPRARRKNIGVTTGSNFPDALAAAPLLSDGYTGTAWSMSPPRPAPLLLTPSDSTSPWLYNQGQLPAGSSYLEQVWNTVGGNPDIDKSFIFGGSGAVSDTTWWQLDVQSPG